MQAVAVAPRARHRSGEGERQRRRGRARPRDRLERRARADDAALRAEAPNLKRGIATLCLGGGNGVALAVERCVVELATPPMAESTMITHRRRRRGHHGQRHRAGVRAGRLPVRLVDVAQPVLDRARRRHREEPREVRREGQADRRRSRRHARAGSSTATTLDALGDADYVVEAIVEDAEAKRALFATLDALTRPDVDPRVEHLVDLDHAARRGDEASRQGARHALHEPGAADDAGRADPRPGDVATSRWRSATELCDDAREDAGRGRPTIPGFIANRILMPMINEAIFAVMEGVGTPEAIDAVMKLGMNHPMGPLTLADFIGLDVCLAILERAARGPRRSEVPPLSAAPPHGRRRPSRPQIGPGLLYVLGLQAHWPRATGRGRNRVPRFTRSIS